MSGSHQYTNLPEFSKFKKLNIAILVPPSKTSKQKHPSQSNSSLTPIMPNKKGTILNYSLYHSKIKSNLHSLYSSYYTSFDSICTQVINEKYQKIYTDIFNFCLMSNTFNKSSFNALVINTDQNSGSFFDGLESFLHSKIENDKSIASLFDQTHTVIPKGNMHFKDLSKLFYDLNLDDLNTELIVEDESEKIRIIVIGETYNIDSTSLNLFLQRIMEYQQLNNKMYNNVLLFDVIYDPRSLFDKIKANLLCKMNFYFIENIPSKNIYKEVLYKFIYENNKSLFIPNSTNLKRVIDYVNNHRISISSFKQYFTFLIFQFFLMHNWDDDQYLLFDKDIESVLNQKQKIKELFKSKLQSIYQIQGHHRHIKDKLIDYNESANALYEIYIKLYKERCIFFEFYKMFEDMINNICSNKVVKNNDNKKSPHVIVSKEDNEFDKYQFFFEFLQLSEDKEKNTTRENILMKYFRNYPDKDYIMLITNYILPGMKYIQSHLEKKDLIEHNEFEDKITYLEDLIQLSKNPTKQMISSQQILTRIKTWLSDLLANDFFNSANNYDRDSFNKKCQRKWLNQFTHYLQFHEITNPSMLTLIMNTLLNEVCEIKKNKELVIKEKDLGYQNTISCFIKCFMRLGSNFKLKLFFWEFLNEIGLADVNDEDEQEKIKQAQKIFLYFCYMFSLVGFFSRKKGHGGFFLKNYYNISNYFIKKD